MPRKSASKRSAKKAGPSEGTSQRLQRLLASAGFGSRRQCEQLIEEGRVHIDGEVVTKLGTTVDPAVGKVFVDGVLLKKQKLVYYAVNKPVGVVTTNRDPHGRPRVVDLVPKSERVFPVGRLDRSSEGLILLTNDGELAQKLTHPKFGVRKVYRVTVAGKVDTETMRKMRNGVYIAEGLVRVDGAKLLKTRGRATELEIVLREGKNREIRRILARLGHKVQQLRRIAVGPLRLGDVPPGAYRVLSREEVKKLWLATEAGEHEPPRHRGAKKKHAGKQPSGSRPTKKSFGKQALGKKSAAKKTPGTRARGARGRGDKLPQRAISLSGSQTIGAVIGGDPASQSETPNRKAGQKRSTKKRGVKKTARRKSASARVGGHQQAKRPSGKPSARKRKR